MIFTVLRFYLHGTYRDFATNRMWPYISAAHFLSLVTGNIEYKCEFICAG